MVPANKSINHDDKVVRERPRGDLKDVLAAAIGLDLDDGLAVFALEAATANLPQHLHALTGAARRHRERPPSRRRESKPYA